MSTLDYFIQQLINALSIGSLYALMAIGLSMVFGILRLINFAHGDLIMVGSYAMLLLLAGGMPFLLAAAAGIAASTIAGLLIERFAYRSLRGAPDVTMLLTSFAVTIFLENLAIILFKATSRAFPAPALLNAVFSFGNLQIASLNIVSIAATAVLLVLLTLFVTKTEIGISMRAASQDLVAARLMGIHVNRVIAAAFAIGSFLAGVVGILWSIKVGKIDPLMGFGPVLKAFVASVIGGLGSIPSAVIGGYILGSLEILLQGLLPAHLVPFRDAFVFLILISLLLFKPNGLLGKTEKEKI
ncbi:MAG: branched-chain amino acid ABC transporter permease [Rectinema subterraneum]|uniref:branched-chain amino acid ABC transporter permease n=1 Tax=Rectinema subterraneum TaxID=2653714 RepID=UPI003C7A11B8